MTKEVVSILNTKLIGLKQVDIEVKTGNYWGTCSLEQQY